MRNLHEELVRALTEVSDEYECSYEVEDHPGTLVRRLGDESRDVNVEVIYLDDVILVQDNGCDNEGRTGFVWREHNQGWAEEVVRKFILPWLQS